MKLQQARKYALSLPETTEEPHFESTSFRVRGKIFATAPPEGTHLHIFVPEEQRAPHLAAAPAVFEALHWGSKVVGVRIALAQANPRTVKLLLLQSWKRKATKGLAASVNEEEE